jgi:hypothetical protein
LFEEWLALALSKISKDPSRNISNLSDRAFCHVQPFDTPISTSIKLVVFKLLRQQIQPRKLRDYKIFFEMLDTIFSTRSLDME